MSDEPKLYADLADWWPLLSPPSEYAEEAAFFETQLLAVGEPPIQTVLELGSGGGNNASFLKQRFEMTLVDLSAGMLAVSRELNPECEHFQGDLRTVRLERTFDAIFIHDAICYVSSEDELRLALETAAVHCRPGGALVIAPDHLRENFEPSTSHGGVDRGSQGLRYLEWTWDPDPDDATYVVDYAFLLRDADRSTRVVHDRHVEGLFSRATWLRLLAEAGFEARAIPFEHSEVDPQTHEVFVGQRRPR